METKIEFSIFDNIKKPQGSTVIKSKAEIERDFNNHRIGKNKFAGGISPIVFKDNYRKKSNAEKVTLIILDVDGIENASLDPLMVKKQLERLNIEGFLSSTHSSTPDHPKFRIVIYCDRSFSPEDLYSVHMGALIKSNLIEDLAHIDNACLKDSARMYLLPSSEFKEHTFFYLVYGIPINVDECKSLGDKYLLENCPKLKQKSLLNLITPSNLGSITNNTLQIHQTKSTYLVNTLEELFQLDELFEASSKNQLRWQYNNPNQWRSEDKSASDRFLFGVPKLILLADKNIKLIMDFYRGKGDSYVNFEKNKHSILKQLENCLKGGIEDFQMYKLKTDVLELIGGSQRYVSPRTVLLGEGTRLFLFQVIETIQSSPILVNVSFMESMAVHIAIKLKTKIVLINPRSNVSSIYSPIDPEVYNQCILKEMSGSKIIKKNEYNIKIIIKDDIRLKGRLKFNIRSEYVEFDGKGLDDYGYSYFRTFLTLNYNIDITKDQSIQYVSEVAREAPYDGFKDEILDVDWDGKNRINSMLEKVFRKDINCIGEAQFLLEILMIRNFMISVVARTLYEETPHTLHFTKLSIENSEIVKGSFGSVNSIPSKVDTIFVIKGVQGDGKSSFYRTLVGDKYYSDAHIDLKNKDTLAIAKGNAIVEISEIESITIKKDKSEVKAFITRIDDEYRAPYARTPQKITRRYVFTGSSNATEILNDTTGSRRFNILTLEESLDLDWVRNNKAQLWAEAVVAFKSGEAWFLDKNSSKQLAATSSQYSVVSEYEETLTQVIEEYEKEIILSTPNLYSTAVRASGSYVSSKLTRLEKKEIREVATKLGFVYKSIRSENGNKVWCYKK